MNNDITELLYRIKENIRTIEDGDISAFLLEEVSADFLGMIELIKLFLISERDSYYGYFLMNMQFFANLNSHSIAGIKLNTFPPLFEANPLLLCKFKLKEILYIICHEIDHVVLNHPAEMVKANSTSDPDRLYEFNLAADAAVNERINYEINAEKHNFLLRPEGIITSKVLSEMYHLGKIHNLENYEYYFELIQGKTQNSDVPQNGAQSLMNGLEHQNDSERGSDLGQSEEQQVVTAKNFSGILQDHNWEAGDDEEDITATVREFVNATVGMMNEEIRSLMPASFMSQIERLNKPSALSWQVILKKYVGTIVADKRKTKVRLNRRQPERFDLSGSMDDKVLKLVVVIDTSGSVDDQMMAYIFNEIFSILAQRKYDITVIECDTKVRRVYKTRTPEDIKTKVAGRGGTWFTPAIEYINEDKYFRDALMIYFTDGYGEEEIPKPRTYRNIWVVIGDARHLSVKEPFGVVLSL